MNVGIITASDKGYLGEREDRSGARIAEIIEAQGYTVRKKVILPDCFYTSGDGKRDGIYDPAQGKRVYADGVKSNFKSNARETWCVILVSES